MSLKSFGFAGLRLAGQELEEGVPCGVAHRGVLDAVLAAVDDDQVPAGSDCRLASCPLERRREVAVAAEEQGWHDR